MMLKLCEADSHFVHLFIFLQLIFLNYNYCTCTHTCTGYRNHVCHSMDACRGQRITLWVLILFLPLRRLSGQTRVSRLAQQKSPKAILPAFS